MRVKKKSAWTFDTSSTVSLSAGLIAGGGGAVYLSDPQGNNVSLSYTGLGGALGIGIKTPGNVGGSIAPASFPNAGTIYILESYGGNELTRSAMTGPCAIVEVSAGALFGAGATAMLMGMSWSTATVETLGFLGGLIGNYVLEQVFDMSAAALIVLGGTNVYTGLGVDALNGYVW